MQIYLFYQIILKDEEGDDNDPFMNLLEGGTKGQAYKDMQFFFYYA